MMPRLKNLLGAELEGLGEVFDRFAKRRPETGKSAESAGEQARGQTTSKDREIARLRALLDARGARSGGVGAENMVWIFGVPRTGSTWLSAMMGEAEGHAEWKEPYVGDVFGYAYHRRAGDWMRAQKEFILGDPYREVWLNSIRTFVVEGANARFPDLGEDGYLIIKEPNGALGARLISEALPESRLILLVRDPRDIVASLLDAQREGSWTARQLGKDGTSPAETNPDDFVRQRANLCMMSLEKSREAYDNHRGRKAIVRYEDLRAQTLETMKRIYATLEIPVEEKDVARSVEKHSWENIPEKRKGTGKFHRKARPGGWREDLTPGQVEIVEEITAPVLNEFYTA